MPRAALEATAVDYIVDLDRIAPLLIKISTLREEAYGTAS
jgi:chemotaxis response regulator CheB